MRSLIWKPSRSNINTRAFELIHSQILKAGIPMVTGGISADGYILNFDDAATDDQIEQALAIAEAYDPVAVEAEAIAKRAERAADMRPFKQVHLLIDDNVRDAAQVDKATLAQLRGLVLNMLDRESILLKAVARLMEGHFIDEGDGQ